MVSKTSHPKKDETKHGGRSSAISDWARPIWAVVTFEECVASGLTYEAAIKKMESLEEEGAYGLCIVTNCAAEKLT